MLLIAITVAVASIAYAFVAGVIQGLSSGGSAVLVTAAGDLSVPGTGSAALTLSVKNSANSPITEILITIPSTVPYYTAGGTDVGVANTAPVNGLLFVGGAAVSATNPLPIGQTASGAATLSAPGGVLYAGTSYSFILDITFANGATQIQTVSILATA